MAISKLPEISIEQQIQQANDWTSLNDAMHGDMDGKKKMKSSSMSKMKKKKRKKK